MGARHDGESQDRPFVSGADFDGVVARMSSMSSAQFWKRSAGFFASIRSTRVSSSGEIPAVWLKSLPSADTTVTDPSLFTYGRLTSSVGYDHELGDEDTGEVVRPIAWTIEGIR